MTHMGLLKKKFTTSSITNQKVTVGKEEKNSLKEVEIQLEV